MNSRSRAATAESIPTFSYVTLVIETNGSRLEEASRMVDR